MHIKNLDDAIMAHQRLEKIDTAIQAVRDGYDGEIQASVRGVIVAIPGEMFIELATATRTPLAAKLIALGVEGVE